jgi:hypothetical protein
LEKKSANVSDFTGAFEKHVALKLGRGGAFQLEDATSLVGRDAPLRASRNGPK